jgi:tRNA (guanine37-N1)-methyltransferase
MTAPSRPETQPHPRFDVITIFPEMFDAMTRFGVAARAIERGLASLHLHQLRDFSEDAYRSIDDRPYGGGPGMVMMPGPLSAAVDAARQAQRDAGLVPGPVVLLSPWGRTINQGLVDRVALGSSWTLVCGRYEGVDQRFIDQQVDELWSLGDFVLSGGELAAMVVIDAAVRKIPGALGAADSSVEESFGEAGILDWPHYTRPEVFQGAVVPEVLLSGHHVKIADWRQQSALELTRRLRPDLLACRSNQTEPTQK